MMAPARAIALDCFRNIFFFTQVECDNIALLCYRERALSVNLPAGKVGRSTALGQSGDTITVAAIKLLLYQGTNRTVVIKPSGKVIM